MTDAQRRQAARRLRSLLDGGTHRKAAFLQVIQELRTRKMPASRSRLYAWCVRFGVSTR